MHLAQNGITAARSWCHDASEVAPRGIMRLRRWHQAASRGGRPSDDDDPRSSRGAGYNKTARPSPVGSTESVAMNNLYRELAPVSAAAWAQIEDEARRTFALHAAARKAVDVTGPDGLRLAG